jgi:hypothetical protein
MEGRTQATLGEFVVGHHAVPDADVVDPAEESRHLREQEAVVTDLHPSAHHSRDDRVLHGEPLAVGPVGRRQLPELPGDEPTVDVHVGRSRLVIDRDGDMDPLVGWHRRVVRLAVLEVEPVGQSRTSSHPELEVAVLVDREDELGGEGKTVVLIAGLSVGIVVTLEQDRPLSRLRQRHVGQKDPSLDGEAEPLVVRVARCHHRGRELPDRIEDQGFLTPTGYRHVALKHASLAFWDGV